MKQTHAQPNRNKVNLIVDSAIFTAFLVAMAPHFSGMAVHEWLGISFGAAIVTHLLLHWQWIVEVTKRFFGKVTAQSRINYVLNALLSWLLLGEHIAYTRWLGTLIIGVGVAVVSRTEQKTTAPKGAEAA